LTGLDDLRIAVVHEWLAAKAGSEFVFEQLAEAFPTADLFALTREPSLSFVAAGRSIRTTFLQHTSLTRERRGLTLPLMPLAWKAIRGRGTYDLVITSAHAFAREFPMGGARHLSYVHAPMRYVWSPELDPRASRDSRFVQAARAALRWVDRRRVHTVDQLVANSTEVAVRIRACYGRSAEVVHPPVRMDDLIDLPTRRAGYALALSRWIAYKRLDVAIEACALAGVPLIVAGSGPEEPRLRRLARAAGGDVRFVVQPSRDEVGDLMAGASVFVFPPYEDFGIVAVEAQAAGLPVVALAAGGALDTVRNGVTGVLAEAQTAEAFSAAIERCLALSASAETCRRYAWGFRPERFRDQLRGLAATMMLCPAPPGGSPVLTPTNPAVGS
jgi:glycosyltransferase involved in cell wall biosynthesis